MQKPTFTEDTTRLAILNSIRAYRSFNKKKYGEIVIVGDGAKNWRYGVFPQYKGKRKSNREADKIDWPAVWGILNRIQADLRDNFPYKILTVMECEADDVIAQLVRHTQEFGNYEPVLIVSRDKDFAQLQKYENVAQLDPRTKKLIVCEDPIGDLANHIIDGDMVDGVPNVLSDDNSFVESIKQVAMRSKLLNELLSDPNSHGPIVRARIDRNRVLIDLDQTPQYLKDTIDRQWGDLKDPNGNRKNTLTYLIQNNCQQLIEHLGDFIQ